MSFSRYGTVLELLCETGIGKQFILISSKAPFLMTGLLKAFLSQQIFFLRIGGLVSMVVESMIRE